MNELHISDENTCKLFSFYTSLKARKNSMYGKFDDFASILMQNIDRELNEIATSVVIFLSKEDVEKLRDWLNELLESVE